jgi:hypothetical protein
VSPPTARADEQDTGPVRDPGRAAGGDSRSPSIAAPLVLQRLCRAVSVGLVVPVALVVVARGRRVSVRAGVGLPGLSHVPFVLPSGERLLRDLIAAGSGRIEDLSREGSGLGTVPALDPRGTWRAVNAQGIPLQGGVSGILVAADLRVRIWTGEENALLEAFATAAAGALQGWEGASVGS